jgi:hypothetical protein
MNPSASTFTPLGSGHDSTPNEVNGIILALGRSLNKEQEDHQGTKALLSNAQAQVDALQIQLIKVKQENVSLNGTVRMLKAAVINLSEKATVAPDDVKPAASSPNNAVSAPNNNGPSIIHDVLQRHRTEYELRNNSEIIDTGDEAPEITSPTEADSVAIVTEEEYQAAVTPRDNSRLSVIQPEDNALPATPADENHIFNFAQLDTADDSNSPGAIYRRNIARHFQIDLGEARVSSSGQAVTPQKQTRDPKLCELSPQQATRGPLQQSASLLQASQKLQAQTTVPATQPSEPSTQPSQATTRGIQVSACATTNDDHNIDDTMTSPDNNQRPGAEASIVVSDMVHCL